MVLNSCVIQNDLLSEWVKNAPATITAVVIGAVAAGITWRQMRVAAAKLNLDLFEKRFKIFEATMSELFQVVHAISQKPANSAFTTLLPQAQFLFGKEIRDYMYEVSQNSNQLWQIQQRTTSNQNVLQPDDIYPHDELLRWFEKNASDGCRAKFGTYLDFQKWK